MAPQDTRFIRILGSLTALTLACGLLVLAGAFRDWGSSVAFVTVASGSAGAFAFLVLGAAEGKGPAWEPPLTVAAIAGTAINVVAAFWGLATGSPWPVLISGAGLLGLSLALRSARRPSGRR
jgi:hypothetical protein